MEWQSNKLGEICLTTSGGTPSRKNKHYYKGTIPWVKSGELRDNVLNKPEEHISEDAVKNSSAKVFPKGTLLIALYGATVGKLAILDVNAATNQAVCAIFPKTEKIHRNYLFYYLLSKREALIESRAGGAQPNITQNILQKLEVSYPPLPEQKRIAAILDKADRLRRLRRYALEVGESYLQSVFLEMFGDPSENQKGWKTNKVRDICDLVRGSSPRPKGDSRYYGGPIPRLMVEDLTRDGLFVTPQIDTLTVEGAKKSRPMKKGSVVMVVSGDTGIPAILNVDACIHDGFVGFRKLSGELNPVFFANLLLALKDKSEKEAVGAIWQNLTTDQIKLWNIICPPKNLQEKFGDVVHRYERLRAQQSEALRQAENLFQSLLAQSFSDNQQSSERVS